MVIPAAKYVYQTVSEEFDETDPVSSTQPLMDEMMKDMIKQWKLEILLSEGGIAEEKKVEW